MDASIVTNFQKLRVLASYDLKRMDELVQDLTNALEETSRSPRSKSSEHLSGTLKRNCYKKRRGRKRRTNSNCRHNAGNFSEASESSLEEGGGGVQSQELRDAAVTTTTHQSDSDDVVGTARLQGPFTKLPCALALAESDSVTENFSPLRPHRRRHRKFKRMSTDAPPSVGGGAGGTGAPGSGSGSSAAVAGAVCESGGAPRLCKRPLHCAKPKLKTLEAKNDNVIDSQLMEEAVDLSMGKRKRNGSSRDVERTAVSSSSSTSSVHTASRMEFTSQSQESSSSFSSSESECGIFTNDEARDGDDEQSDFFHEPGPACEVPGIVPWWENELTQEATFNSILTGSFQLLASSPSKPGLKSRVNKMGREIRSGRRRLKPGRVGYPSVHKQKPEITGLSMDKLTLWHGSNAAPSTGDVKRRRQTPPQSPSDQQACCAGENADPTGNQMLEHMTWTPGQPVGALRSTKRKGLGTCDES